MLDPYNLDHYNDQPTRIPRNSEKLTNIWIGDLLKSMNAAVIVLSRGRCCVLDALYEPGMAIKQCHSDPDDLNNHSVYPSISTCSRCISEYLSREQY